jgi:hypothetical protein
MNVVIQPSKDSVRRVSPAMRTAAKSIKTKLKKKE